MGWSRTTGPQQSHSNARSDDNAMLAPTTPSPYTFQSLEVMAPCPPQSRKRFGHRRPRRAMHNGVPDQATSGQEGRATQGSTSIFRHRCLHLSFRARKPSTDLVEWWASYSILRSGRSGSFNAGSSPLRLHRCSIVLLIVAVSQ